MLRGTRIMWLRAVCVLVKYSPRQLKVSFVEGYRVSGRPKS